MCRKILVLIFSFFTLTVCAQKDSLRHYSAVRTESIIKIDGVLDEPSWKTANVADNFRQYIPDEGKPATRQSEVRILYDNQALYIGGMFYDVPDSVLRQMGIRDDYSLNTDVFKIGFDTYNNQQDAYIFEVTAAGVQRDNRAADETYDGVWYSKARIVSNGWVVEMKIPYSALRFPSVDKQVWGFQLARTVERRKEYDQWAYVPKGVNTVLNYWGKLEGIENINAPRRISLTPFAGTGYQREPVFENDGTTSYSESYLYNFGADLKYGFDEKFTLDLTLMPDFSQVQSDNKVKNLSYEEVTYNENRQFFKEGTELFSKGGLFYSRRIGKTPTGYYTVADSLTEGEALVENPSSARLLNAFKISGRNNQGLGIGLFNAITANTWAVAEDSAGQRRKILTEPLTNFNIVVLDQQLKNNSTISFINTSVIRDRGWQDANVSGLGWTFFEKKKKYATDGALELSQLFYPSGIDPSIMLDQAGTYYFAGIRKAAGSFLWGASHTYIGKHFETRDMGYFNPGNRMRERLYFQYNQYSPGKYFQDSYNGLTFTYTTNPENGRPVGINASLNLYATLKNYWGIYGGFILSPCITYNYYEPRVPGLFSIDYPNYFSYMGFATDSRKKGMLDIMPEYGDFLDYYKGKHYGITLSLRYRLSNRLQLKYSGYYADDNYNIGFATFSEDGSVLYGGRSLITTTNSIGFSYVIRYGMNVTVDARHYRNAGFYKHYYNLQEDGFLSENTEYNNNLSFNYNSFYINFLYSWEFAPGSRLTLSYKNQIEAEDQLTSADYISDIRNTLNAPQMNIVSLKVLYYLDYATLSKRKKRG